MEGEEERKTRKMKENEIIDKFFKAI